MRNRLINEKSPYLLQHATNPVDWYPWGEEAFKKAKEEDKPVFLSIGYSTCHWCHVMARESFEDDEVAKVLNEIFVCIKVDREERPDIDNVYMAVCQAMTGSGGWPLSIFMTAEKKPFYAGTYFSKENRYGRPGIVELARAISEAWKHNRQELVQTGEKIVDHLQRGVEGKGTLDKAILDKAYAILSHNFDEVHGGFGRRTKFPTPHNLYFLLRYWKRTGQEQALHMVEKTLEAMGRGGIYDQLGFGFHRYSTDRKWLLPHFEKMLYDQALIAMAYLEAYQVTKNKEYGKKAKEILAYVLRDMTSPEGAFYSALDADSEGEEGRFYVWSIDEFKDALGVKAEEAIGMFGLEKEGNFLEEASGQKTGKNVLWQKEVVLEDIREQLFAAREKRIRPMLDDKVLTDWNGLMIASLALGGRILEGGFLKAAERAMGFVLGKLCKEDGRLFKRYRDGEASLVAHVDDYAFIIWALIELYESSFKVEYLKEALRLNEVLFEDFWDDSIGGYFFTARDSEELFVRNKEIYDGAIPSGNSVALLNNLRLARLTGNLELEKRAEDIMQAFAGEVKRHPSAYTMFLCGLDFYFGPGYEVVLTAGDGLEELLGILREEFSPNTVVLLEEEGLEELVPFVADYRGGDRARAYVCTDYACKAPVTEGQALRDMLV